MLHHLWYNIDYPSLGLSEDQFVLPFAELHHCLLRESVNHYPMQNIPGQRNCLTDIDIWILFGTFAKFIREDMQNNTLILGQNPMSIQNFLNKFCLSELLLKLRKYRVKPSPLPDSWKLKEIFATDVVLGT